MTAPLRHAVPLVERDAMATLVLYPEYFPAALSALDDSAWTDKTCRMVWPLLKAFHDAGQTWSFPLIAQRALALHPARNPLSELSDLLDGCPYRSMFGRHVREIQHASLARKVVDLGISIARDWMPGMPVEDMIDPGAEELARLRAMLESEDAPVSARLAAQAYIEKRKAGKVQGGMRTPWPTWNIKVGGLFPGTITVFGARPSTGKTAIAITLAMSAARDGVPVLFVTTETTRDSTMERMLAHAGDLDAFDIRTGSASTADMERAQSRVPDCIQVRDSEVRIEAIRAMVSAWRREHAAAERLLLVVDFLELVQAGTARDTREQQVSKAIEGLQDIARKQRAAVVVMSQLARPAKGREKKDGPELESFRYSGMIESLADVAALVSLPGRSDDLAEGAPTAALACVVRKNRVGGCVFRFDMLLHRGASKVGEMGVDDDERYRL